MARQLYRMYLYIVSIALLVLAAFGLGMLLSALLAYTPLRGSYRLEPGQTELIQSIVFAVTAWIIAAALGALHLRLIRRDIAEYPEAARGSVRAFFLNGAEAIAMLVAVFTGSSGFTTLAYAEPGTPADTTGQFSAAVVALLLVIVFEVERRRYLTVSGAPVVFQRLHMFGVPIVMLLVTTLGYWGSAMLTSVEEVLIRANLYNPIASNACATTPYGYAVGPCSLPNAVFLWLAVLIPAAAVVFYAVAAWKDMNSLIRTVAHIGSLCLGIGALLFGLVRGIELLLRWIFGIPVQWSDVAHPWNAPYDFISPLSIGVLLVVIYGLWIRAEKADLPPGARTMQLATEAAVAVIFAAAFWWGTGRVAYTIFQWFGASAGDSFETQWAGAIALAVAGLAYIPLAVHLRLSSKEAEGSAPRRGFILALLAGGIVTGAVGLTITLYIFGTNLLGAPLTDWEQTVRAGLAVLVVGVILVVSYGWVALQERSIASLFKRLKEVTATPQVPVVATQEPVIGEAREADVTEAIEQVLKEYEGHRIGLHEAAERVKTLTHVGA